MAFKTWDVYFNKISDMLSGGDLFNRGKIAPTDIKPVYSRIITRNKIKRVILIDEIDVDYKDNLSEILNNIARSVSKDTSIILTMAGSPTKLDYKSPRFRRQMKAAKDRYQMLNTQFQAADDTTRSLGLKKRLRGGRYFTINKEKVEMAKSWSDSYDYILQVIQAGGSMYDAILSVEVYSDEERNVERAIELIGDYFASKGIKGRELKGGNAKYLKQLSPTGYINLRTENKDYTKMYLSDENISYLAPYKKRGVASDGKGILLGVDAKDKLPFTINYLESGQAQINLLCALSGHGKTFQAFLMACSCLVQGHHVSALDIKGGEWEKLFKFIDGVVISIGGSNPRLPNILRLDDLEVDEDSCEQFYRLAVSGMKQLVNLLCGLDEKNSKEEIQVVNRFIGEAVDKLYLKFKVYPDSPASFRNTAKIKYVDLIPILNGLRSSTSLNERHREILDNVLFSCSEFFRGRGEFAGMLDNEITLQEVIDKRLVIYSLDKNEESTTNYTDSIKTFLVQFLDKKKQTIRAKQGKFTFVFFEELQRKGEFKSLIKFISGTVTGARSSNVTVFLLCNTLSIFREPDEDLHSIASNITSFIIGRIGKHDINILEKDFQCESIIPYIKEISENPSSNRNVFAVHYDTGKTRDYTTIIANVTKEMEEAFATRTIVG